MMPPPPDPVSSFYSQRTARVKLEYGPRPQKLPASGVHQILCSVPAAHWFIDRLSSRPRLGQGLGRPSQST